ncbi:hypothetical protein ABFX02_14G105700 [Erythranthe guttata]
MAKLVSHWWFLSFLLILVSRIDAHPVTYDPSFTHECLSTPLKPQYNGGIIINPELNEKLNGWIVSGDASAALGESRDGNNYIITSKRKQSIFSQKLFLEENKLYTFSAWVQVSNGNDADVAAIIKTSTYSQSPGAVIGREGCWSMLKGGFVVNVTGPADLYFESTNPDVDIYADSISLQQFTEQEWKSHQDQSIENLRKSRVKFQALDQHGRPISNATVSIKQLRPTFPFGTAITAHILDNTAYQNWFLSRFQYTVFENEMKWYAIELERGVEDYAVCDAMVRFAEEHGIRIRGHNVLWDDPRYQPEWVKTLPAAELTAAAHRRMNSVMNRYSGKLFHWDVMNENLHFGFFESQLGANASAVFFERAHKTDPKTVPYLNEYNTIEVSGIGKASPPKYMQKIALMREQGYNGPLGIGLEAHFPGMNLPYIRAAIDQLASAKLPIWITELDVKSGPNQAMYLEQIMKELHSHWAVEGIMMWAAWNPTGCYAMCLTDNNFKNLPTGDVVDEFISELTHAAGSPGTTNGNGLFGTSLFHGEYEATVSLPNGDKHSCSQNFSVVPNEGAEKTIIFKIDV